MRLEFVILFFFTWVSLTGLLAQVSVTANPSEGCDTLTVTFDIFPASAKDTIESAVWNFGNNMPVHSGLNPTIRYTSPGLYTVTCLINDNTLLTATELIEVREGPLAIFTVTDTVTLSPYGRYFKAAPQPVPANTYTYQWEFSDGVNYFAPSFIRPFDDAGTYNLTLTVTDQTGCSASSVQEVVIGNLIEIPNVFSPNNDNINDYLIIRTNGINIFSLEIYTRSGTLIYKNISPTLVWDGRSMSGQEMSPGIYYYVLKQVDGESIMEKSGFVHLLK